MSCAHALMQARWRFLELGTSLACWRVRVCMHASAVQPHAMLGSGLSHAQPHRMGCMAVSVLLPVALLAWAMLLLHALRPLLQSSCFSAASERPS